VEEENRPGVPNERGLEYIQRGLDWCHQNGLRVILDLHKAPGFSFNSYQTATLFDNVSQQERFLNLWEFLAKCLKGTSDFVAFELLNEIFLPDSTPWNRLLRQAVDRIRKIDIERLIVIGGNYFNSASELAHLDILDDPNILYTFHFYEPMVVTHQKAHWEKALFDYNQSVDYPGVALALGKYLELHPEYKQALAQYSGKHLDKSVLDEYVRPALDFVSNTGQVVYCGEYGVIELASMRTRVNWTRDFVSILRKNHIGRAFWSYKAMDFGLVDWTGKVVNKELVKMISKN
jgi:hypothetical protein